MTPEQLKTIEEVASKISSSNWLPGYETEDIRQEAIIIGIQGIKNYNGDIPLDKYLHNHMKHRLRSLRRNKHIRPGCNCGTCTPCITNSKKLLVNLAVSYPDDEEVFSYTPVDTIEHDEFVEYLDKNIPAEFREDYLKLLAGIQIVFSRKVKIREIIRKLIDDIR